MIPIYRTTASVNLRYDPINESLGVVPFGYVVYGVGDLIRAGNATWIEAVTCTSDGVWRFGWMARTFDGRDLLAPVELPSLACPVRVSVPITQLFGENPAKYAHLGLLGHNGIDLGTVVDTPVVAVDSGRVIKSENDPDGYGLLVKIAHVWGSTISAHLSHRWVDVGQSVARGETIGLSGNTGWSSGPHLHFEARINEVSFDPLNCIDLSNLRLPTYMPHRLRLLLEERQKGFR